MTGETKKIDITTGVGRICFPRVFEDTKGKKDDKVTDTYDIQILIPKTQRDDLKALANAVKQVGEAKWGAAYKQFGLPLRDGDKEAALLTEDGKTTRGEKYPERIGHYFMNARSSKPVSVVGRDRSPIVNSGELYGGCYGKINVTFYPYNTKGNQGIAAGLNGVQFIGHGEPFGSGAPTVDSMFDILDEADDSGLDAGDDGGLDDLTDDAPVEEAPAVVQVVKPPAAKKTAAKKAAAQTPAQKAAAAKLALARAEAEAAAAEAEAAGTEEDEDLLGADEDADGLYEDLDDSES